MRFFLIALIVMTGLAIGHTSSKRGLSPTQDDVAIRLIRRRGCSGGRCG